MARKKKLPPWGKLGDGKPIERGFATDDDDWVLCEWFEADAKAEQYRRMARLKEYFGIQGEIGWRPWYELAVKLASEIDPALTVVDPRPRPTGKTAPRARSAEGLQVVEEIEAAKDHYRNVGIRRQGDRVVPGEVPSILALLREHQDLSTRYRDMTLTEFEAFYFRALSYSTSKRGGK